MVVSIPPIVFMVACLNRDLFQSQNRDAKPPKGETWIHLQNPPRNTKGSVSKFVCVVDFLLVPLESQGVPAYLQSPKEGWTADSAIDRQAPDSGRVPNPRVAAWVFDSPS